MALTDKDIEELGLEEATRWKETHTAIVAEIHRTSADYEGDRKLARELTSQIVAAKRDEDKAALASDEAVAHGLSKLRKEKTSGLDSLEEQPYFARVVTEEESRQVEFRLGTASFPAQRIIDWRKAPISKLYYDYREGDDFAETIQGKDREGIIQLRRSYHGNRDQLSIVETSQGTIHRQNGKWHLRKGSEPLSRTSGHDGHLPPILSLITADQFGLITRDAQKPIVIQGIAGSGKTTVALHRLAWLLHEDNSNAKAEKCLVVMFNPSLKAYIETTLPELKVHGVPIRTFHQWCTKLVTDLVGPRPTGVVQKFREWEQFKSSTVCLDLLNKYVENHSKRRKDNFIEDLFQFFGFLVEQEIFWPKWDQIRSVLKEQISKKLLEAQDDPLILHLVYAEHGYYPVKSADSLGICDHIVVDEAQDFGLVEIRDLLNAVDRNRTVTIVGDIAQKIIMGRQFDSWETMLRDAGFEETTPISMTVSHRSTREIMKLASHIRNDVSAATHQQGGGRSGPIPSFLKADAPQNIPHLAAQWIRKRLEENPNALSAVLCRWPKEAEELTETLRKLGIPARFGDKDQFDFSPGVTVTNIHQVKGLEFRNVLVIEPSEENYHLGNEEERNLLYVAVTRAEVQLDFLGSKPQSKLIPTLPKGKQS